jgi:hypothetical protein
MLHPRRWARPEDVPREPFVALRLYEDTWDIAERRRDPSRVESTLVYEHRR